MKYHRDWDPDLTLAETRGPRNFDGNAQRRVRLWLWAYVDRFEEEDFEELGRTESLDWVIVPLPGIV